MDDAAARAEANAEDDANGRTPTWARLEQQIAWYDRAAQRSQLWHRTLKVIQLVLGAAVPVAAATGSARWLLGALGALVVVIEGVQQLFQFHRNWIAYRSTCEALRRERHLFQARAGDYAGPGNPTTRLAERIELLVGGETAEWSATERSILAAQAPSPPAEPS